jgi:hypothetical protein
LDFCSAADTDWVHPSTDSKAKKVKTRGISLFIVFSPDTGLFLML